MNVFDFDKTIFYSDSTAKFYFYCLRHYPKTWLYIPSFSIAFAKYFIFKKGTKTRCKEVFYRFLRGVPDVDKSVDRFWDKNFDKMFSWYKDVHKDTDVVISAGPEFLLERVCERLGAQKMMASRVDKKTGKYTGENCHGEEKVRRFYEAYPEAVVDEFYSDSMSDLPMAKIAKKAFAIDKKGNIHDWAAFFGEETLK